MACGQTRELEEEEEEASRPHLKGQLKRYLISLLRISSHFCNSKFWRRVVFFV